MDRGMAETEGSEVTYKVTQYYYINNDFGSLRVRHLKVQNTYYYDDIHEGRAMVVLHCYLPETEKVKEENGKQTETQTRTENTTGERDTDRATTCVIYWCKRNKKCFANHGLSSASRCINI